MMNRQPSRAIQTQNIEHLPWRVSYQDEKSKTNKAHLTHSSRSPLSIALRAPKCKKYQFITSVTIRRVTEPTELELILEHSGIDSTMLKSPSVNLEQISLNSRASFLSLELFDDWEFDSFDSEKVDYWKNMEALAFLPSTNHWQRVTVASHEVTTNCWKVERFDQSKMTRSIHWVPRLYLYFPFEDPYKFVSRIVAVSEARQNAENAIRFRFLCRHIFPDGSYAPGRVLEQSMLRRANEEVYAIFRNIYEDYHVALAVRKHLSRDGTMAIKPPMVDNKMPEKSVISLPTVNIDRLLDRFTRTTLFCTRNVYNAVRLVNQECEIVRKLPLFIVSFERPIPLEDFEKQNQTQTTRTLKYLQNTWIERTTMQLHRLLSRIGEGDFNVNVSNWDIYLVMKLNRLNEQVLFRMQDALRDFLLDTTEEYVHRLVNDCLAILSVEEDYSWDGNLIDSPFEPKRAPVFYLKLEMGEDAPYYSTDPVTFPVLLRSIMDTVLTECHFIHTIEPSLMQSLIFSEDHYLSSVGLLDAIIVERRRSLVEYYEKSLLPLQAYAARYGAFKELFFTNVKEFVEHVRTEDKTSSELKEDIALQIRMRENLEHTVPQHIVIGPFWINVQPLREALIQKRYDLTMALLKLLTEKLRHKTADVIAAYNVINERVCQKPVSIEHIYDIRAYMEDVPELVSRLEDRMRGILYEYEILEGFLYNLPDTDFEQKWQAQAFPRIVLKQTVSVREFLESEVDRFRKQQFADEAAFTASIEDINAYISKFTTLYDVSKVSEMSVEVRRLWKALQELIDRGHTMNRRQELFEMAPISLNNLYELQHNFGANRELWTTAADYLKLEETWIGNPLASVDLGAVRRGLQQTHDTLKDLMAPFRDQPQLLAVVEHFVQVVEAFRPNLDVMEQLKCPFLEAKHWGQLAKETGIKGKLSADVGFDVFLEHGFRDHLETVRRVAAKAEQQHLEQEVRLAEEERIRQVEAEYRRVRAERRQQRTEL